MLSLIRLALVLASTGPLQQEGPPLLVVGQAVRGSIEDGASVVETHTLATSYTQTPTVGRTFRIEVERSGPYTIELRSYFFDAYLVLRDARGEFVAEDDDGLIGTHSRLVAANLESGRSYSLEACALHGSRGPFELVLKVGVPAAASVADTGALELDDAERRVKAFESVHGAESAEVVGALHTLGMVSFFQGARDRARLHWERGLAISETALGHEHPDTVRFLNNLAGLLRIQGDLAGAGRLYERALAISESALGPEHRTTATYLNNLASLLRDQGELAGARPLYERALAIREKALGPEHLDTAGSLNDLGQLLESLGDYSAARALHERSLAIREETLGNDHLVTAESMNNLAVLLEAQGDYAAARPLQERALAIRERALGPDDPQTASSLNNLAALLVSQGDYAAARPLSERALEINERVFGREHPKTAWSLNNLAVLLEAQGDHAAARSLQERALSIREKTLGPDHLKTAASLSNLAGLLQSEGNYRAARPLFERVLAISEETLGPDHPLTATSLGNLAVLLEAQGDYAAARSLQERALAISEKALGPEHPDTATSLNNLARLLRSPGEHDAAQSMFERALAISEKSLGPDHPETAISRGNLAALLAGSGEPERAWRLMNEAHHARSGRIEVTLAAMTEGERYLYLARVLGELEFQLSMARLVGVSQASVADYGALLEWKGRAARLLAASREQIGARLVGDGRELLDGLRRTRAALSRLALETDIRDHETHYRQLDELRAEGGRLERELLRLSSAGTGVETVGFEEVKAALEPASALVDFFAHRLFRPGGEGSGTWGRQRFTVWITRTDHDVPIEIDLGPAARIDEAVHAFLRGLMARRDGAVDGAVAADAGKDPAPRRGVAVAAETGGESAAALRTLVWEPVLPYLDGIETVFVSPDGALGALPFETLPLEGGSLAIERFAFVYLQDATSLTRHDQVEDGFDSLLSVGGVDFGERSASGPAKGTSESQELRARPDIEPRASDLRRSFTDSWHRLPATEHESQVAFDMHGEAYGERGRRLLLQGGAAREERLKQEFERYSVLHLATHGYFQPEGLPSMWEAAKAAAGKLESRMSDEARRLVGKHPGLLSGLVCAGANRGADDHVDDGYLTAEEVGWLDLSGVELIVLSACETGLGRPQSGEGLIGLRHAFQAAGARTVISSLWSVNDESTAELMSDFYKNLFLKGMGRHQALRAAQLAMLARNRMEHGEALPSTWGAFVLSGEWR